MTAGTHVVPSDHGDLAHGAGAHPGQGAPQGTRKSYLTGFALAVILTVIPFGLVMSGALPKGGAALLVIAFAALQIVVHMVFFLHMNSRAEGGWIMLSSIFTVVLVVIALTGSLWVMYHMNANMMPMPMSTPAAAEAGVAPASPDPMQTPPGTSMTPQTPPPSPQNMPGMTMP